MVDGAAGGATSHTAPGGAISCPQTLLQHFKPQRCDRTPMSASSTTTEDRRGSIGLPPPRWRARGSSRSFSPSPDHTPCSPWSCLIGGPHAAPSCICASQLWELVDGQLALQPTGAGACRRRPRTGAVHARSTQLPFGSALVRSGSHGESNTAEKCFRNGTPQGAPAGGRQGVGQTGRERAAAEEHRGRL